MFKNYTNSNFSLSLVPDQSTVYLEPKKDGVSRTVIKGYVKLDVKIPAEIQDISVSLNLKKQVQWFNLSRFERITSEKNYKNSDLPITTIPVNSTSQPIVPSGSYIYSFELWVPENLEPSFNSQKNFLNYYLQASVRSSPSKSSSFSLSKLKSAFQESSITVPIIIRLVPDEFSHDYTKAFYQQPTRYNIYNTDGVKVTLQLPSQYLSKNSCSPSSPFNATLLVSIESKDQVHIKIKSAELSLTQKIKFNIPGVLKSPSLHSVFGHSKPTLIQKFLPFTQKSHPNTHPETVTNNQCAIIAPNYDSPKSHLFCDFINENATSIDLNKNPNAQNYSFTFSLPDFESEPIPTLETPSFNISHYLTSFFSISLSNSPKPIHIATNSKIFAIPSWTQDYKYCLPLYENSSQDAFLA
ncbi:hypothetical protein AYI69_g1439 [Smittium culicis]|uniref:Arrestin-like N-terminal domain-containing protein n=1 Tax=Smittium culicis TaxID=133412 RepID=A0A1R1YQK8_9FUNG|nr:hypothetical protein AYI69_g1439 [Smittium culicis]